MTTTDSPTQPDIDASVRDQSGTITIVLYPRAQELLEQFDRVERERAEKRAAMDAAQAVADEAYAAWQPIDRRYDELLPEVAAALGFGELGRTSYSWRVGEALKAYRDQKEAVRDQTFAGPPTTTLREDRTRPKAST